MPALRWKLWGREDGKREKWRKGEKEDGVFLPLPFLHFPFFHSSFLHSSSESPSIPSFPIRILTVGALVPVYVLNIQVEITIATEPIV
jgi:hypothetical protein